MSKGLNSCARVLMTMCWLIVFLASTMTMAGAVVLERLAYYGISLNLISYLTNELHEGTAEALTNVWTWGGVVWILPLITGVVADAYLGRYLTIMYSMSIYLAVCISTS
jgi:peptide/histidine transporter 3/4